MYMEWNKQKKLNRYRSQTHIKSLICKEQELLFFHK